MAFREICWKFSSGLQSNHPEGWGDTNYSSKKDWVPSPQIFQPVLARHENNQPALSFTACKVSNIT